MTEHKMDYSDLHDYERDHKVSFLPPIWKKQLKPAIHLRVFRNGDEKFSGKTITWDVHKQNNFVSFMNELSIRMKLTNGDAVWRLFTPRYGHRVSNFDRFQDGTMIVAAGNENFKPLSYEDIPSYPRRSPPRSYDPGPNHFQRFQVSAKARKIETHGTIIKCWINGNITVGPRPILVPPRRGQSVDEVIGLVSAVLSNHCGGTVSKLYLPDGTGVLSLDQIGHNGHYIAVRKGEKFKRGPYPDASLPNITNGISPTTQRRPFMLAPLTRSDKTSLQSSPQHSHASHGPSENSYSHRHDRDRWQRGEDGVGVGAPLLRPVKHERSPDRLDDAREHAKKVDYDADHGRVFRAQRHNKATLGAIQVPDTRETRTELPIDRRPAEEVKVEAGVDGAVHRPHGGRHNRPHNSNRKLRTAGQTNLEAAPGENKDSSGDGGHERHKVKVARTTVSRNRNTSLGREGERSGEESGVTPGRERLTTNREKAIDSRDRGQSNAELKQSIREADRQDDDRDDDVRKERAANTIQRHVRGHIARKQVSAARHTVTNKVDTGHNSSTSVDESHGPQSRSVDVASVPENLNNVETDRKDEAARMIQQKYRRHRGHRSDKEMVAKEHYVERSRDTSHLKSSKENNAALRIQKEYRNYRARSGVHDNLVLSNGNLVGENQLSQDFADLDEKGLAATKIQANFRGHLARRDVSRGFQSGQAQSVNVAAVSSSKLLK